MPRPDAAEQGSAVPWLSTLPSLGSLLGLTEAEEPSTKSVDADKDFIVSHVLQGQPVFSVGDLVEYDSASVGQWIPAKVLSQRPDGLYNLDCKPGVPAERIRAANITPPDHEVGADVEYLSESQGTWISAKVQRYNAVAGTYDLDVKPNVTPARIRAASTRPPSPEAHRGGLPTLWEKSRESEEAQSSPSLARSQQEEVGGSTSSRALRPAQAEPMQLVRVSRHGSSWRFEVNEDAAKVLESYGQQQVSICTVCGPYRTGKSYLLNLLLGRVQRGQSQFRVGSTTRACTEGLWMWGVGDVEEGTSLLFLDCEGFGSTDSDKTRDAKLMALCMLLSSVFLLNTKGILSESLFNALSLVCHMAEHIEGGGQETSKPALLWLLRDFLLELTDEEGHALTADEYLETSLRKRLPDGVDPQRTQAAREAREALLRFFPQRQCSTLVQPVIDEMKLQQLSEVPFADLRPDFRLKFQELRSKLLGLARQRPKMISGQLVSAAAIPALLRKLVAALNQGSALNVVDAWGQVQHTSCEALSFELSERASAELQKVRNGHPLPGGKQLPMSEAELSAILKAARRQVREEWRSRALGEEELKAEYWKELKTRLADDEKSVHQLNQRLAEEQLRAAGADWEAWLGQTDGKALASDVRSQALLDRLEDGSSWPSKPLAHATREALASARINRLRLDGTMDALKAELKLATDELASQAAAAQSARRREGEQLQQNLEVSRLQGQVEALQHQAREAIERERSLREQVLTAEEAHRKEQRATAEAIRQQSEAEKTVGSLQAEVADLRAHADQLQRKEGSGPPTREKQPKCTCAVM
mmetsp:Transcript_52521/g.94204  ORF Transcript_52521/g.94204 Transcript_52521/m.94204 type:complete len:819 (+) Transcript_52521:72-2528(+)